MTLAERIGWLAGELRARAIAHEVPGATIAVIASDELVEAATGVINRRTGVTTTTDAVFQIGSITKLMTATLIMQLIEQGRFTLDTRVQTLLPGFQLGDAVAAASITVRQLLCHSSGMDGDFFEDTGRGDDGIERYLLAMRALPQLHAPGAGFSYCNAGFVVLGRIIEVSLGVSWHVAMRDRLFKPLGMRSFGTTAEQTLRHRAAIGHVREPGDSAWHITRTPFLALSNAPAGATPFGTAADLLRFARCMLGRGELDGQRVLQTQTVEQMWQPQNPLPHRLMADSFGLAFMRWQWGDALVVGHDGGTSGQFAFMRLVPAAGVAIALLTNGGDARALYRDLFGRLLSELATVQLPVPTEPSTAPVDLVPYIGRYERLSTRVDVSIEAGQLIGQHTQKRFPAAPVLRTRFLPAGGPVFLADTEGAVGRSEVAFLSAPDALHMGGRLHPKVA